MSITITVQSLNPKTIDLINIANFSQTSINNNIPTNVEYSNLLLNIHTNLNSFNTENLWLNLSGIQQDFTMIVLFAISGLLLFTIISYIKLQKV